MKFPSLESLVNKSAAAFKRFPVAMLLIIVASVFAIMCFHVERDADELRHTYLNVVMTCYLGMLLFISIVAYTERSQASSRIKVFLTVTGLAVLVIYYLQLNSLEMAILTMQFALFTLGLHLLISFIPFLSRDEVNGFWQYNKNLFLRILLSGLYSAILFIGLSLAILAIDQLFKVDVGDKIYAELWVIVAGIFNTWFFLEGFPEHVHELENRTDYPKGLKIITQYILLPLITIYLLILYAYMFKIIFSGEWPAGWVSYLVLAFSIAGIFSLLLIHPVRNEKDNQWMIIYSRFFYMALFPLVILLFFAIKRRIDDYSITENRYFVLVLATWLVVAAIYFLFSKSKNIKLIPFSLCLLAFLTSFGPWGAFKVSLHSQKKHLSELLDKNKMLADGKIKVVADTINADEQREISSVVGYIVRVHGYKYMQDYFSQNLDLLMKSDSSVRMPYSHTRKILELMNLTYINSDRSKEYEETHIDFRTESEHGVSISGFSYYIPDYKINNYESIDTICNSYHFGNDEIKVCFDSKRNMISISSKTDPSLLFDLATLIKTLKEKKFADMELLKKEDMTLTASNEKLFAKIIFKSLNGERTNDSIRVQRINADIFFQSKDQKENEVGERKPE